MMTVKKVILTVVGTLFVAAGLYSGLQYARAIPYTDEILKAEQLGKTQSKEECLLDTAATAAPCDNRECMAMAAIVGASCMSTASGPRKAYCDVNNSNIPKTNVINEICKKAQPSEHCYPTLHTAILYYCVP